MGEPEMGKIIVSENVTLDGSNQDPTGEGLTDRGGWFGSVDGADREAWAKAEFEEALGAEALLMGRGSYEYFVARGWETRTGEWADRLRSLPKHVVSSTEVAGWANTSVLRGDVPTEISKLKETYDGDIIVYASTQLVPTLLEHNLVDEIRLMIFPFIAGGPGLFTETPSLKPLRFAESRPVGDNLLLLRYVV
jgi:dihydrofolate reductase